MPPQRGPKTPPLGAQFVSNDFHEVKDDLPYPEEDRRRACAGPLERTELIVGWCNVDQNIPKESIPINSAMSSSLPVQGCGFDSLLAWDHL